MSQATDPPPLIPGLPGIARPPVLVTGGTGRIGSQVVRELLGSGVPARVLTRSKGRSAPGAHEIEGDLSTGSGLPEAVDSVQAVIHCASDAKRSQDVDIDGTRRLCATLAEHNAQARLIHVSIVGCWDNPLPYYRAKAAAETASASVRWRVLGFSMSGASERHGGRESAAQSNEASEGCRSSGQGAAEAVRGGATWANAVAAPWARRFLRSSQHVSVQPSTLSAGGKCASDCFLG